MSERDRDAAGAIPARRLWGGGFREPLDPEIEAFCESFSFDRRLLRADLAANRAWAASLASAGILADEEAKRPEEACADCPRPRSEPQRSISKPSCAAETSNGRSPRVNSSRRRASRSAPSMAASLFAGSW